MIKYDDKMMIYSIHLKVTNLSHHAVPNVIDLFTVFTVSDQVKIIGKFDIPCDLLQDVYTEALAALLDVGTVGGVTAAHTYSYWNAADAVKL